MSEPLENLVRIGQLTAEPSSASEITGLIASAEARLRDAENADLSLESRFDLAYNAAHALALAALRSRGYRSSNRFVVFHATVHTSGLSRGEARILSDAHRRRNLVEYEGFADVTRELVEALLRTTAQLRKKLLEQSGEE